MSSMNLLDIIISKNMLDNNKVASTQGKILKAAIQLFAEKGYANTSTNEIAKSAKVAEGTIFRYYKTKEQLLLSIVMPFIKELVSDVDKDILKYVDPNNFDKMELFLKAFLTNRVKFLIANKEIFQIVVKEFLYRDNFRKNIIDQFKNLNIEFLNSLNRSLYRFKESNEIRELPNEFIIRMIVTTVVSNFLIKMVILQQDENLDYEKEINSLIKFIMNGIKN